MPFFRSIRHQDRSPGLQPYHYQLDNQIKCCKVLRDDKKEAVTDENETIRWPTNLDRNAIEQRLVKVREAAVQSNLADLASRFADVEAMPAGKIATNVVAALTWLLNRPEHERPQYEAITKQLEMVALNLKNLK